MIQPQHPDFGGIQITPEDYAFMEFIQSEISEDGQIPFTYPAESMPKVIKRCAMFFYEEYADAVQEQWLMIKASDIRDSNQNRIIELPEDIQNVFDLHAIDQNAGIGSMAKFANWGMLSWAGMASGGGAINGSYTSAGSHRGMNMHDREMAQQEGLMRLWEVQSTRSMFKKGVRFSFNKNNHKLVIQSSYSGNLVLSVFRRITPQELYNDRLFVDYVVASCLKRVKRVIGSFGFKLPGNVELNIDTIVGDADDRARDIEKEIKEMDTGADLILFS